MITKNRHPGDAMSDWVMARKAADIAKRDSSNLFRAAGKGRIPFRVKEGHVFYYKPVIDTWEGAPIGNPDRIEAENVCFDNKQADEFRALRKEIEERWDDVIYEMVVEHGRPELAISVCTETGWQQLANRKLSSRSKK